MGKQAGGQEAEFNSGFHERRTVVTWVCLHGHGGFGLEVGFSLWFFRFGLGPTLGFASAFWQRYLVLSWFFMVLG